MSKQRLLQQRHFYSRSSPGHLADKQEMIPTKPTRSFNEVLRHLVDRKYIYLTSDGYCHLLPKGLFVHEALVAEAAAELEDVGALRYRFAGVFSTNREDGVWSLVSKFEEQMYGLAGREGQYFKYASDPLLFEYLRGRHIETPHRIYSPDYFYRAIKSGELRPLIQPREFYMTDFHFFCEAGDLQSYVEASLMNKRMVERFTQKWWINIDTNTAFFEAHRPFFLDMLDRLKVDGVINVTSTPTHYYSLQSQFMVDYFCGNTTQLANLQFDEKNGDVFQIQSARSGKPVVVIHGTILGRTEKVLALLVGEQIAGGGKPMLPIRLAPIVVRVIPVDYSEPIKGFIADVVQELDRVECRYDVDDRDLPLRRRVSDAERDWIPYQATVGMNEVRNHTLSIRDRVAGVTRVIPLTEFVHSLSIGGRWRAQLTPKRFYGEGLY